MASLPEFVGTVHIFLGPYRGNPIALYLQRDEDETTCHIAPRIYPWNCTIGSGETPNKAAAAFEAKWKAGDLAAEMYSGPHWEGGIKPEKPKPPPKPAAAKPAVPAKADTAKPSAPTTAPSEKPTVAAAAQPAQEAAQATPKSPTPEDKAPSETSTSAPVSPPPKADESTQQSPTPEIT